MTGRDGRPRIGVAAVIAAACAAMRAGATLAEAFEHQADGDWADGRMTSGASVIAGSFATMSESTPDSVTSNEVVADCIPRWSASAGIGRITVTRLRGILAGRALPKERGQQIESVATELAAAVRLSESSGCPAVRCLEVVADSYRRARLLDDLRAQAFAVPQATVKLLSALPLITVMLGELLGAKPLSFLFGSTQGATCLGLGMCCYAAGVAWMRAMLRDMDGG
ncbi:pilus assembly protein [Bifidobacterium aerophilum]|uniref:Pilus assembly protein n=2 Tax=Bifidobacterium aerophilum TaxID=1798155 RepID=A0A6N9Z7C4_9BIFI|nr:pilus assembly protein [Bifidobacterium aerophilum]